MYTIYYSEHSEPDLTYNNPIRTIYTHPYSYDPILVYKDENFKPGQSFYSDRMSLWDSEKLSALKEKMNLNDYCWRSPNLNELNLFISEFFNKPLKITRIVEMCNVSNGYPYWLIGYEEV